MLFYFIVCKDILHYMHTWFQGKPEEGVRPAGTELEGPGKATASM